MSKQEFSIAYDGRERTDDHSIDVQALAPALLAIGRLIREANAEFNAKRATAKVLVVSDFEHKCFNINFEVVLNFYEQLKTLLGAEGIKTAKDVLEWLGLLGLGSGGTVTFLKFLAWRRGRKVINKHTLSDMDRSGMVEVTVEGDNNPIEKIEVHNHILSLAENPKALRATRDAFIPLGHDGFDVVRLRAEKVTPIEEIGPHEIDAIVASCNTALEENKNTESEPDVEVTPAWLSVYSPVYDAKADKWRFRMGREVIYADITETNIAQVALERGGAMAEDAYQVSLQITTPFDAQGKAKDPHYKILKVVRFVPASPSTQPSLFDDSV